MQRREFLREASFAAMAAGYFLDPNELAAASVTTSDALDQAPAVPPYPPPFDSPPVLQNPSSTGITVFACVSAITTAWVEYGPTEALGQITHSAMHGLRSLSGRVHRIRLEGLAPNTKYHYRVFVCPIDFRGAYKIRRGEPVASAVHSFTTLDDGRGLRASFNVINDTHENPETLRAVTGLVAAERSHLTFWNGDVFNDVRSDQQIVDQMVRPAGFETGTAFAASTPLCFVSGNHDVRGIHARSLDNFLDVPDGRRHYLLRQGPVALIVLDTGEDKPDDHPGYAGLGEFQAYRALQRTWLEKAVREPLFRSATFRVVVQHIPMFGKAASDDSRAQWQPVLSQEKIDLMICGHVHEHAFHDPNSEHSYAQVIGGGPAPPTATFMHVEAERRRMTLRVTDLTGKELLRQVFRA